MGTERPPGAPATPLGGLLVVAVGPGTADCPRGARGLSADFKLAASPRRPFRLWVVLSSGARLPLSTRMLGLKFSSIRGRRAPQWADLGGWKFLDRTVVVGGFCESAGWVGAGAAAHGLSISALCTAPPTSATGAIRPMSARVSRHCATLRFLSAASLASVSCSGPPR